MEKREINIKSKMEKNKVISYLDDLVRSLKEGTVCVQQGTEIVTLRPSSHIEMEMEASMKKHKERICIELTWNVDQEKEEPEFSITASEPASVGDTQSQ